MPEIKQVVPRDVRELLLDPENPRLPPDLDATDQYALLRHFDDNYNLDELAQSMLEEGFFAEEPLLTIPGAGGTERVVVEGNRRLATLKLLLDEESRAAVDRSEHWSAIAAHVQRDELEPVPTFEYESRDELLEYLGFRHVTGVVQWTAEAKARYVVNLVRRDHSFAEVARAIGTRTDAVRRQFVGWCALEQAERAGEPVEQAQRFFGVFYRALQSPGIRTYMGIPDPRDVSEQDTEPVQRGQEHRVAEVSSLLFGLPGTSERAVVTDSRQLTNLGRVLQDEEAARVLREDRDFALALEVVGGDRASIEGALTRARSALIAARGHAFEFVGDPEIIDRARALQRVLDTILETLGEPSRDGEPDAPPPEA
jgi:hypothetical protein